MNPSRKISFQFSVRKEKVFVSFTHTHIQKQYGAVPFDLQEKVLVKFDSISRLGKLGPQNWEGKTFRHGQLWVGTAHKLHLSKFLLNDYVPGLWGPRWSCWVLPECFQWVDAKLWHINFEIIRTLMASG